MASEVANDGSSKAEVLKLGFSLTGFTSTGEYWGAGTLFSQEASNNIPQDGGGQTRHGQVLFTTGQGGPEDGVPRVWEKGGRKMIKD